MTLLGIMFFLADVTWHGGVEVRADERAHPVRIVAGGSWCAHDAWLVLDPLVFADGQADLDAMVSWESRSGGALFGGWRNSSIALSTGRRWFEHLVLGVGARLPPLLGRRSRLAVGAETAILLVEHGGGLPVARVSLADRVAFGIFLRIEHAAL